MEVPKPPEIIGFQNPDGKTLIHASMSSGSASNLVFQVQGNSEMVDANSNSAAKCNTGLENGFGIEDGAVVTDLSGRSMELRRGSCGKNVLDEGMKGDGMKFEVSGDHISLYVDFSSPLTEVNKGGAGVIQEAGPLDGQEFEFTVGDFVWIRMKNISWWPGRIIDPSALKDVEKDFLLVLCFGNSHVAPCHPSLLRPFHLNFGQISRQNKSKSFLSAVEMAVYEFSIDKFKPAEFLSQIRNLAVEISVPSSLECIVALSRVSAFYRFLGHRDLPLHILSGETVDKETVTSGGISNSGEGSKKRKRKSNPKTGNEIRVENEIGDGEGKLNSEKGFELRERKKSKFLSYPYVNLENPNTPTKTETDQPAVTPPTAKTSAKRSQRKWFQKFNDVSANPELINASPAELLSELLSTAVDCMYSVESKNFGLTEWFFSKFRISVYHEESNYETNCNHSAAAVDPGLSGSNPELKKGVPSSNPEKKTPKRKKNAESENSKVKSLLGQSDVNVTLNTGGELAKDVPGVTPSSLERQQTPDVLLNKQSTDIPDLNWTGALPASVGGNSQVLNFSAPEPKKRRKKRVSSEQSTIIPATGFPVVNGNNGAPLEHPGIMPATGFSAVNGNNGAPLEHPGIMPATGFSVVNGNNGAPLEHPGIMPATGFSAVNGNNGAASEHPGIMPATGFSVVNGNNGAALEHSGITPATGFSVVNGINGAASEHSGTMPAIGFSVVNGNNVAASEHSGIMPATGFSVVNGNNGAASEHSGIMPATGFSVVNGNNGATSEHSGTTPATSFLGMNQNNISFSSLMMSFQVNGPYSIKTVPNQNGNAGISPGSQGCPGNSASLPAGIFSITAEEKPVKRRWKRKTKAAPDAVPTPMPGCTPTPMPDVTPRPMATPDAGIPDLNGTSAEQIGSGKDSQETTESLLPTDKPQEVKIRRRRKRQSKLGIAVSANYDGGSTLILAFAPGASIPSKEALIPIFSKFGPLRESETQVIEDLCTARVVFLRTADAGEAARSLDESKPFGPALIRHQLQIHPNLALMKPKPSIPMPHPQANPNEAPPTKKNPEMMTSMPNPALTKSKPSILTKPKPSIPVPRPQANPNEAPPIDYMKKNLEMMTSMLGKSGNNLSPEMRAKLEMEIQGLLSKISSKPGSSSS